MTTTIKALTDTALAKQELSSVIPVSLEKSLIRDLSQKLVCFADKASDLENDLIKAGELDNDIQAYADFYNDVVFADMQALRAIGDDMETQTGSDYWPYPSYGDILFSVN